MLALEDVAARFDEVAALMEAPVERDAAWHAHWEPRSRGVASESDHGYFFSGRAGAFRRVYEHLRRGSGLLVVTAHRGHGKSALLARAVVLSCRRYRTMVGDASALLDADAYPPIGGPSAAVFARGLSPGEVATQIAQQLGYGDVGVQLLPKLCSDHVKAGGAPSVVVDAVDESSDPSALLSEVVVPLADNGARIVIGALRKSIGVLRARNVQWVDLDAPRFADNSIELYVTRRLTTGGYACRTARGIAGEVARRAQRNFLYAELVARVLAEPDRPRIDTGAAGWRKLIPTDVSHAFWRYLDRFGADREHVLDVLHALARARGDGLTFDPPDLWLRLARALRPHTPRPFGPALLREVAERAGDYLLVHGATGALRLYHEGLADTIMRRCAEQRLITSNHDPSDEAIERELRDAERRFVDALATLLPERAAPLEAHTELDPYLLAHVATHLADVGRASELLQRPGLLLTAHPDMLRAALVRGAFSVPATLDPARVAVVHVLARPAMSVRGRAATLRAALRRQRQHTLADAVLTAYGAPLPYELISAPSLPSVVSTIPGTHDGYVESLAVADDETARLIITGGWDGALRSWHIDGSPGQLQIEDAHSDRVSALAVLEREGAFLIVSGGADGSLRSWHLDGTPGGLQLDHAYTVAVQGVAVTEHGGAPLIISAGMQGQRGSWNFNAALRSWRLDGTPGALDVDLERLERIQALAVIEHNGEPLITGGGEIVPLRSWYLDGTPGQLHIGDDLIRSVAALVVVEHDGAPLIVTADYDRELRSWRPEGSPGQLRAVAERGGGIGELAVIEHDGAPLIIGAGQYDGSLRSWRLDGAPGTWHVQNAHKGGRYRGGINALTVVQHEGTPLVITAGNDEELRIWRPAGAPTEQHADQSHADGVLALTVVEHAGASVIISAGYDKALRSWALDGTPGPLRVDDAHPDWIVGLGVVEHNGAQLVISVGSDGTFRSWYLDGTSGPLQVDDAHPDKLGAFTLAQRDGAPLIVSAGHEGALLSWHVDGTPGPLRVDDAHAGFSHEWWSGEMTVVDHDGALLIISGSSDGALRSWHVDGTPGRLLVNDAHPDGYLVTTLIPRTGICAASPRSRPLCWTTPPCCSAAATTARCAAGTSTGHPGHSFATTRTSEAS